MSLNFKGIWIWYRRQQGPAALSVERHNIGLDPGDCSTGGKKWLDSGYNLKVEPLGAADNWI